MGGRIAGQSTAALGRFARRARRASRALDA